MKFFAIPALGAALALAACSETNTYDAEEGETAETATEAPVVSETTVVTEGDPAEPGDSITVSEDGVTADIGDGDTRVQADVDGDPSLTVENE